MSPKGDFCFDRQRYKSYSKRDILKLKTTFMTPFNNFTDPKKYLFSNDIFHAAEEQYKPYQNGSWAVAGKHQKDVHIITTAQCWTIGKIVTEKILTHIKGEDIFFVTAHFEAAVKRISSKYKNQHEYQKRLSGYPTCIKELLDRSAQEYKSVSNAGPLMPVKNKHQNKFNIISIGHLFLVYAYTFMNSKKIEQLFTRELLFVSDCLTWNPLPFYS